MNRDELISFYEQRRSNYATQLLSENKQINVVSNLRLLNALVFLVLLYFAFAHSILFYVAIPLLVTFALLVRRHSELFDLKVHLENLVRINDYEILGLKGDISCFRTGDEYIDFNHPYTHDLDIFGSGSLFQSVNRGNTLQGRQELANRLSEALDSAEVIRSNQIAVQDLAQKTDFRQHFQAAGMEIDELPGDREQLLGWLEVPSFVYSKPFFKVVLFVLPAITIACVATAFFVSVAKPIAIFLALAQWAFLAFYIKRVNVFFEYISKKKTILEKYAHILHFLQKEKFNSPLLRRVSDSAREADNKVKSLASLVSTFNARLNAMANVVVNSLLMYDLNCVYRLEKWKYENSSNLKTWLDVVSEAEVLCSIGTFAFNHPSFVYASIGQDIKIEATEIGHPLIPENECVPNDFTVGKSKSVLIITGANMAGKSTFLRTIGVNLVLALSGAPLFARSFRCPVIAMRSGMRTADSLKDHQSYFFAELNRLKTIMDELRSDKPLLILLDEILKGTNSTDKQVGSIALVKQLLPQRCLALIATHDLAMGELAKEFPDQVENFCFEATIENDQLSFDYKLKPGLAQKMNATFLMRKMGILLE
jgi:hypothetical protein